MASGPLGDANASGFGVKDRQLPRPLLQSHGNADTIVPLSLASDFEAANKTKKFLLYSGYDHNDPLPDAYYDALATFLDDLNRGR